MKLTEKIWGKDSNSSNQKTGLGQEEGLGQKSVLASGRLNEGLSTILWHITTVENAIEILIDGELKGMALDDPRHFGETSEIMSKDMIEHMVRAQGIPFQTLRRYRSVSFARSPSSSYLSAMGDAAYLRMDGRRLSNLGRSFAIKEWKDEFEDRLLLAPGRRIEPIERFCKSIHIRVSDVWNDSNWVGMATEYYQMLGGLAADRGIALHFHSGLPFTGATIIRPGDPFWETALKFMGGD